MIPQRWARIRRVFEQAIDVEPAGREQFLIEACRGDPALLRDVRKLLDSDRAACGRFEPPARAVEPNTKPMPADGRIGAFRIRRVLGSGGMGTVFEAEQESPHRTVALKVMRLGFASDSARRRFRYESEVLARLQHPGIATIHEAGTHREAPGIDLPYIAMELVPAARDIQAYANESGLDWRARVDLFLQVCDAIQYAHQKGIIHRDLKPSNLLVDESGRVKVIDFGVARATERAAAETIATEPGQIIGTLAYMSPEQLESDPSAVDVRSDVYSLGVVLFELFSGRLPYNLERRSLIEAARIIREVPHRRAPSIAGSLSRELACILDKALAKEAAVRYASAGDLAADIRRLVAGEPLAAGPQSTVYRLRKFARRHRAGVAATSAILALLAAGLVGTTLGWKRAVEHERTARDQVRRSAAIQQILHSILILASPQLLGPDVKLLEGLAAIVPDAEAYFEAQPDLQVIVLTDIGHVYLDIGQWETAETILRRAVEIGSETLGPSSRDRAHAHNVLGLALLRLGRAADAESQFHSAREILDRTGLRSDPEITSVRENLAMSLHLQGRDSEALPLLESLAAEHTRAHGSDHPSTLTTRSNLAQVYRKQGRLTEALRQSEAVVEARRRTLGSDALATLNELHNLAAILTDLGRFEEAYGFERESISGWTRLLGRSHPHVLDGLYTAGACALVLGDSEAAVEHFREIADSSRDKPPDDSRVVAANLLLASALLSDSRIDDGLSLLRANLPTGSEILSCEDASLKLARGAFLRFEAIRRKPDEALPRLREMLDCFKSSRSRPPWSLRVLNRWLASALEERGLMEEAASVRSALGE
jgi:tetratricopeptide (TPR) repeat protein